MDALYFVGHSPFSSRPFSRRHRIVQRRFWKECIEVRTCPWASRSAAYRGDNRPGQQRVASLCLQGRAGRVVDTWARPHPCQASLQLFGLQLTCPKIRDLKEGVPTSPNPPPHLKPCLIPLSVRPVRFFWAPVCRDAAQARSQAATLACSPGLGCDGLRGSELQGGALGGPVENRSHKGISVGHFHHLPGCSQEQALRPSLCFTCVPSERQVGRQWWGGGHSWEGRAKVVQAF